MIQSLHVRPLLDADGQETGLFEVPAGGRRFRALELLVKQKRLATAAPVPCVITLVAPPYNPDYSLGDVVEADSLRLSSPWTAGNAPAGAV